MSAAEKLRTMYAQESSSPYDEGAETGLFDALPEIIAVVEAAENCPCSDYGTLREQCPQCVALAALAAKLEKR